MNPGDVLWWFATAPFAAMGALALQLLAGLALLTGLVALLAWLMGVRS